MKTRIEKEKGDEIDVRLLGTQADGQIVDRQMDRQVDRLIGKKNAKSKLENQVSKQTETDKKTGGDREASRHMNTQADIQEKQKDTIGTHTREEEEEEARKLATDGVQSQGREEWNWWAEKGEGETEGRREEKRNRKGRVEGEGVGKLDCRRQKGEGPNLSRYTFVQHKRKPD